ncbi:P-loop containing nucleoside triphosphate hydrolase protein [Auriculariales sp. MPI-PUGE-AT-0066]|nr:P-loop containing nucleoside triphosphate hydrolase protein [Auriculariales sp. MPI-PUGE-AT-0066]
MATAFAQLLKGKGAARCVATVKDPSQLHYFFDRSRSSPTVLFLGRANVGKSSLINKLVHRRSLVRSGQTAGLTKQLEFYGLGEPLRLFLVDAPGYGSRGRPEWGAMVDAYLDTKNNHLQRVYILLDFEHGLETKSDPGFLRYMNRRFEAAHGVGFTYQAVFTKFEGRDATLHGQRVEDLRQEIQKMVPTCLPPIFTSAREGTGIDELQASIGQACGLHEKAIYREEMERLADFEIDDGVEYHHIAPRSPRPTRRAR